VIPSDQAHALAAALDASESPIESRFFATGHALPTGEAIRTALAFLSARLGR